MTWSESSYINKCESRKITEASLMRIMGHGERGMVAVSVARSVVVPLKEDGTYDFESWQSLFPEFFRFCLENSLPLIEEKDMSFSSLSVSEAEERISSSGYTLNEKSCNDFLKKRNKDCDTELYKSLQSDKNPYSFTPTFGGYRGNSGEISRLEPSFIIYNDVKNKDDFAGSWEDLLNRALRICKKYKQDCIYVQAPGRNPEYLDKDGNKQDWFNFKGYGFNVLGSYYTSSKRKIRNPKTFTAFTESSQNAEEFLSYRNEKPKSVIDIIKLSKTGEYWDF